MCLNADKNDIRGQVALIFSGPWQGKDMVDNLSPVNCSWEAEQNEAN